MYKVYVYLFICVKKNKKKKKKERKIINKKLKKKGENMRGKFNHYSSVYSSMSLMFKKTKCVVIM